MNRTAQDYEQLLDRFVAWAQAQPDIRAIMIIGSRARAERPADEWSDLDLWVVTADPDRLLSQSDWLENVGTAWISHREPTATGGMVERRVLFEGGLDVDFVPAPVALARQIAAEGWPPEFAGVIRRGARFVLDKDGLAAELNIAPGARGARRSSGFAGWRPRPPHAWATPT
jgi:aminoglycoside 6-adenylyltransferase